MQPFISHQSTSRVLLLNTTVSANNSTQPDSNVSTVYPHKRPGHLLSGMSTSCFKGMKGSWKRPIGSERLYLSVKRKGYIRKGSVKGPYGICWSVMTFLMMKLTQNWSLISCSSGGGVIQPCAGTYLYLVMVMVRVKWSTRTPLLVMQKPMRSQWPSLTNNAPWYIVSCAVASNESGSFWGDVWLSDFDLELWKRGTRSVLHHPVQRRVFIWRVQQHRGRDDHSV